MEARLPDPAEPVPAVAWPTVALFFGAVALFAGSTALALTDTWPGAVGRDQRRVLLHVLHGAPRRVPPHDVAARRGQRLARTVERADGRSAVRVVLGVPLHPHAAPPLHEPRRDAGPGRLHGNGPAWTWPLRWATLDLRYSSTTCRASKRPRAEWIEFVVTALIVLGLIGACAAGHIGDRAAALHPPEPLRDHVPRLRVRLPPAPRARGDAAGGPLPDDAQPGRDGAG